MLSKFSAFALLVPFVSALQITTPANATSGEQITITWTNAVGDPATFSLELTNPTFNNAFAIANNVQPASGTITLQLPIVPSGDGYTIQAVNITNINQVFSNTGDFSVAPTPSGSVSSSASATGSAASSSGFGTTVTVPPSQSTAASGSGFATVSGSNSGSSSASSSASNSGSSTTGASPTGPAPAPFNAATTNGRSYAAMVLGAVAGAALAF